MFLTERDDIIEVIYKLKNSFVHRQIEVKGGLLFMRAKKRSVKHFSLD